MTMLKAARAAFGPPLSRVMGDRDTYVLIQRLALVFLAIALASFFSLRTSLIAGAVFVYVLPSITAWERNHRQAAAITALNLLLGWTLAGWAVALVWAYTREVSYEAESAA